MGDARFYRRWIAANGWAEAAGLGTTFLLARMLAPGLEGGTVLAILAGALAAVLLGTVLEGVVVGVAQASVLAARASALTGRWVAATAIGAGLAWLLGMVPATVMALGSTGAAMPAPEPPPLVQYGLASVLGLVAGPVLGLAQWTVLRRIADRPARWLGANALAWAVGMPLIFAGMDVIPWEASPVLVIAAIYAVCGVAGLAVGAIHGLVLVRILVMPRVERSLVI